MAEVEDTKDLRAKWVRYASWALAGVWAVCWMVFVGVIALLYRFRALVLLYEGLSLPDRLGLAHAWVDSDVLAIVCVLAVPGWVAIAIAGRWPAAGGAVLAAEGLILLVPCVMLLALQIGVVVAIFVLALVGGLCLASGTLHVTNWSRWRSRASERWTWKGPRLVVAIPVVLGVPLGLLLTGVILGLALGAVCSFTECVF